MDQTTEVSLKPILCIICLEDLDNDIMKACDTCNINCHINCLYNWYKKNKMELCPICLKSTDNNINTQNESFENTNELNNYIREAINIIREENNRTRRNNRERNNNRETIEIDVNNIQEIFDNERDVKMSVLLIFCICLLVIMAIVFVTT
tara:strand:- start:374 stop:823 length:450 start_codon:yes stop_codon:yes gene_type:complete